MNLFFLVLLLPLHCFAGDIIALVAEQIIDGIQSSPVQKQVILVQDARIVGITDKSTIPAGTKIINLKGAALLPGLIDSHARPLISDDDYQSSHLKQSSAYKSLKAYKALERLFSAGWTSVRVAGDADVFYGNQDTKRLINEDVLTGPRIFGAAHYLSITGGAEMLTIILRSKNLSQMAW